MRSLAALAVFVSPVALQHTRVSETEKPVFVKRFHHEPLSGVAVLKRLWTSVVVVVRDAVTLRNVESVKIDLGTEVQRHDDARPSTGRRPSLLALGLQVDVEVARHLVRRLGGVARELGGEQEPLLRRADGLPAKFPVLEVVRAAEVAEDDLAGALPEVLPAVVDDAHRCLGADKPLHALCRCPVEAHHKLVAVDLRALLFQEEDPAAADDRAALVQAAADEVAGREPLLGLLGADLADPLPRGVLPGYVDLDEVTLLDAWIVPGKHDRPGKGLGELPRG
mmetsp:Transcript_4171/g.10052  ORF Transcript_4171/g.10052 Transcript_4171/m.10052 type:complete len:280 (+) Transcript_4171:468-1307(+)